MKKNIKIILVTFAIISIIGLLNAPIVFAWGNSGGSPRKTYTKAEIDEAFNDGTWGDKITFNSITDGDIGDEREFVAVRENTGINAGVNNKWHFEIEVEDGKTYIIRAFVHNNSPKGYDAIAKDTKVAFGLPQESGTSLRVNGLISSSNATPNEYWDYVDFESDVPFHLEYVYGSALLENNGIGSTNSNGETSGVQLPDEIVTNASNGGTLIGFDKLDGNVPGCYEFSNFVSIEVRAVFDTDYTVENQVRLVGSGAEGWMDNLDVKVGDEVEYRINYQNTSDADQENVMVRDILPENMEYIPNTTVLFNSETLKISEDGAICDDDTITTEGINIGNYSSQGNAQIRFRAKVVDETLTDSSNTLTNWAQVGINDTIIQDSATINVQKEKTYTAKKPISRYFLIIGSLTLIIVLATWILIRKNKR